MAFVIHPLTQQNSEPKYTASDFRLTVSNFLVPGTGERFGAVQGVRWDAIPSIVSMSGSTITVHPHSGIIAPWTGVGAYAYAITSDITVPRPTTGDYYVVLTVEDPSQSHGSEPQGRVDLLPVSTPRASILGLVIAQTHGSRYDDIANRLRNSTEIVAANKPELDLIKPARYTKARVQFGVGVGEYEYDGRKWVPINLSERGFFEGTSNTNGIVELSLSHANLKPAQVFLTNATIDDDNRRFWLPVVWSIKTGSILVRLVDIRDHEYTGRQDIKFSWLALF